MVGDPVAARELTDRVTQRFVRYLALLQPVEGEDAAELDVQVELELADEPESEPGTTPTTSMTSRARSMSTTGSTGSPATSRSPTTRRSCRTSCRGSSRSTSPAARTCSRRRPRRPACASSSGSSTARSSSSIAGCATSASTRGPPRCGATRRARRAAHDDPPGPRGLRGRARGVGRPCRRRLEWQRPPVAGLGGLPRGVRLASPFPGRRGRCPGPRPEPDVAAGPRRERLPVPWSAAGNRTEDDPRPPRSGRRLARRARGRRRGQRRGGPRRGRLPRAPRRGRLPADRGAPAITPSALAGSPRGQRAG